MGAPEERAPTGDTELATLNGACTQCSTYKRTLQALSDREWTGGVRKALKVVTRFHVALGLAAVLLVFTVGLVVYINALKNHCTEHQLQIKYAQSSSAENGTDGEVLPPCGDDWIWYRNKCYNFSEGSGNWTEAKDSCTALNSSLAMIDTQKELSHIDTHVFVSGLSRLLTFLALTHHTKVENIFAWETFLYTQLLASLYSTCSRISALIRPFLTFVRCGFNYPSGLELSPELGSTVPAAVTPGTGCGKEAAAPDGGIDGGGSRAGGCDLAENNMYGH